MLSAFKILPSRSPADALRGGALPLSVPQPVHFRLANAWRRDPRELVIAIDDEAQSPLLMTARGAHPVDQTMLARMRRGWSGLISAVIEVPVGKCLVREISLPKPALRRADEVLQLDLTRTTPFRTADVLSAWYTPRQPAGQPNVTVHQVVLKRTVVASAVAMLEAAGIPLREIRVTTAGADALPVNLLPPADRRPAAAGRFASRLVIGMLVAVAAVEGVRLAVDAYQLDAALAKAEQAQQSATTQVQALRRQVGEAQTGAAQIRQPRLRKLASQPVVATWNELTRVLPASTTLTELKFEGAMVQLDGTSANASELIGLLASSPLFSRVAFASPVTRDTQRGVERFQIRLQAGRAGDAGAEPRK